MVDFDDSTRIIICSEMIQKTMNVKFATLFVMFVAIGLVGSAYAHKSEVIGDYKIGVGWGTEPPVVGKLNQLEVMISTATTSDKTSTHTHMDHKTKDSHGDMKKKTKTKSIPKSAKTSKPKTNLDYMDTKIISISTDTAKMTSKDTKSTKTMDKTKKSNSKTNSVDEEKLVNGVTGLAKDLQVDITLNGKKTTLTMNEDPDNPGRYVGDYIPNSAGYPTVHIYVKINGKDVEGSFHPEKVEAK